MCKQKLISNKFDLELVTTFSSYWCTAIFTKSRSLHYILKKQEEIDTQSENDTKNRGMTTSNTDTNERRGKVKQKTTLIKKKNDSFQNQHQREKEAKVKRH